MYPLSLVSFSVPSLEELSGLNICDSIGEECYDLTGDSWQSGMTLTLTHDSQMNYILIFMFE